jgi:hypothetical protein
MSVPMSGGAILLFTCLPNIVNYSELTPTILKRLNEKITWPDQYWHYWGSVNGDISYRREERTLELTLLEYDDQIILPSPDSTSYGILLKFESFVSGFCDCYFSPDSLLSEREFLEIDYDEEEYLGLRLKFKLKKFKALDKEDTLLVRTLFQNC